MNRTTFSTTDRAKASWVLVDASQEVLGRMAAEVAKRLQGKHRPDYTPHADVGDFVVVVNAAKVRLTGRKSTGGTRVTPVAWWKPTSRRCASVTPRTSFDSRCAACCRRRPWGGTCSRS